MRTIAYILPLAFLASCFLLLASPASAGVIVLNDNSTLRGIVNLVPGDSNISLQIPDTPTRTFKFSDVKSVVFDPVAASWVATPNAALREDFVPWARAGISEVKRPRIAEITHEKTGTSITFRDATEAFNLHGREYDSTTVAGNDRSFVFQKLEWDGEITARLAASSAGPGATAGLMICETLDSDAPFALISRGLTRTSGATFSIRSARGEEETLIAASRPPVPTAATPNVMPPSWLKLRRTWDTIRAYESADGLTWNPLGETRVEMDDKKGVYIGVMASTPSTGILITFDSVQLAGRRTAAILPGAADPRLPDVLVRLRDGTVLVGMLSFASAKDAQARIKKIGGQTLDVPFAAIARAQFAPLTRENIEKIAAETSGALTSDGDFLSGELKEIQPENVTVSSVNFGLTTIERRRVTLLIFQPIPDPAPHLTEIHLQDGSLLVAKKLSVDKSTLILEEPLMGPLKYPIKEVLSLDRRP